MLYLVLSKMKSIQMSNTKEPYLTNVSSPARDAMIGSFQLFPQVLQNTRSSHGTQTMSACQLEDLPSAQYRYLPQISTKVHTESWNYDWKPAGRKRDAKKVFYPPDHKSGAIRKQNLSSTWVEEYEGLHTLSSQATSKQLSKTEKTDNGGNLPQRDLRGWWKCCECSREINSRLFSQSCPDCGHICCDSCTEL